MPSYRKSGRWAALPSALTLAIVLSSCDSPHPLSPDAVKSTDVPTQIAHPNGLARTNGRVSASSAGAGPAPVISRGDGDGAPHKAAAHGTGAEADDEGVTLNYVDTDVREIVRQVLGDILKVNYVIDSGFQGQATIQTSKPLKREELLPTLQTLLSQNGGSLTYQNGLFRIGPADDASVVPPVVDGQTTGMGSQVVNLRFASAKQLVAVL
jgi:type II secretory pathway component GspD/PulD (secretin)